MKIVFFLLALFLACAFVQSAPVYESALLGYWNMNETSGAVVDATGHLTGTMYGTISRGAAGRFGNAYYFNSAGSYIDFGSHSSVSPATISAWVNLYGYTAYNTTNPFRTIMQINNYYQGSWSDTALYLRNGYVNAYTAGDSTVPVSLNTWTHVAMTNDGSTIRVYINGVLNNSFATTGQWNNGWSMLRIGGGYDGDSESFYGLLDEVALFGRALTASEILAQSQMSLEQYYAVPEPGSLCLLFLGIVSLVGTQIRREKRNP